MSPLGHGGSDVLIEMSHGHRTCGVGDLVRVVGWLAPGPCCCSVLAPLTSGKNASRCLQDFLKTVLKRLCESFGDRAKAPARPRQSGVPGSTPPPERACVESPALKPYTPGLVSYLHNGRV